MPLDTRIPMANMLSISDPVDVYSKLEQLKAMKERNALAAVQDSRDAEEFQARKQINALALEKAQRDADLYRKEDEYKKTPEYSRAQLEKNKREFIDTHLGDVVDQASLDNFNAMIKEGFGADAPPQFQKYGDHIEKIKVAHGIKTVSDQSERPMNDLDKARAEYLRYQMGGNRNNGDQLDPSSASGSQLPQPQRKLQSGEQKEIFDAMDITNASNNAIKALSAASEINKSGDLYSGYGASARAGLMSNFGGSKSSDATQNYENIITGQVIDNLKASYGGNPTEGERNVLMDLQASVKYPKEVRDKILSRAVQLAERRAKYNQAKSDAISTGEIYSPGFSQKLTSMLNDEQPKSVDIFSKMDDREKQIASWAQQNPNNPKAQAFWAKARQKYGN